MKERRPVEIVVPPVTSTTLVVFTTGAVLVIWPGLEWNAEEWLQSEYVLPKNVELWR